MRDINKTVLIITDGIGYNKNEKFNAFSNASKPTYEYLFKNVPNSLIKTYGEFVGLPNGQMGNSEVGHMTIGAGRILYQDLVKINLDIKNDELKNNPVLINTINKSNNIHLIGLISDGGVHSHIDHIINLAKIAQKNNKIVYIHIITDGRDVPPQSAKEYVKRVIDICNENIQITTISGRYYAMDRDNRWDRVKKYYDVLVNNSKLETSLNILDYIEKSYQSNIFDEFIEPIAFNNFQGIQNGDGVIFCNYRSDRMRELSSVFALEDFKEFAKKELKLNLATMTEYNSAIPLPILYPKTTPKNTLSEVIANAKLSQLHTAETEKYAHVTFFFNGGVEEPLINETRVLIPSPNVATYDLQPQMSAFEVCNTVLKGMEQNYDFIVVNFANGDMVGHTGNYEASIKAVETVDECLGKILKKAKKTNYNILITSDHGNCEMMKDEDENTLTNHTVGDVFCFVIAQDITTIKNGSLNNIAPTVLKLMNLELPNEMDEPLI